jgi:hypothetical protein
VEKGDHRSGHEAGTGDPCPKVGISLDRLPLRAIWQVTLLRCGIGAPTWTPERTPPLPLNLFLCWNLHLATRSPHPLARVLLLSGGSNRVARGAGGGT